MPDRLSPVEIFLSSFAICSVAGLAAHLRGNRDLTMRQTVSAMLNSGLLGLAIAFLWYTYFDGQDNVWFLMGVSLLAGLGGVSLLDFLLMVIKRGGIDIQVRTRDPDYPEGPEKPATTDKEENRNVDP